MTNNLVIHWFRQDLRLHDNPSLSYAAQKGDVMPIYILETPTQKRRAIGSASKWWLHNSLNSLKQSLNGKLYIFSGTPHEILIELMNKYSIIGIYWNRCYDSWSIEQEQKIKQYFEESDIELKTFNASLLWEPWDVLKDDGTPYKVFTPFYKRGCLTNATPPKEPLSTPKFLNIHLCNENTNVETLKLIPKNNWHNKLAKYWNVGENFAKERLKAFLENDMINYKEGRNYPAKNCVSRLSPYLHWGEISPNFIWHQAKRHSDDDNVSHFLSELGWREFSYYLIYHFPLLPQENFQKKFDLFPWQDNKEYLARWQKGITGYPIVDAGMRELWETGYMHNRVRMIVGSFLVKNLLIDWRNGESWFWDCLVDADLANNSAGWQWVAGSGADAAPYFRIFNPVTQGIKFDEYGKYTRKYIPEIAKLPDKYLFAPWNASQEMLNHCNIKLGIDYPKPIVNLSASREKALQAYKYIQHS